MELNRIFEAVLKEGKRIDILSEELSDEIKDLVINFVCYNARMGNKKEQDIKSIVANALEQSKSKIDSELYAYLSYAFHS